MKKFLRKLFKEENGATMTEYLIVLAIVAVAGVTLFLMLTGALEEKTTNIINSIK
jgi:Flp pilus assembly pilin Flp